MKNNNIVLIGFMASGKTAVGQALAKKFKLKYISTDTLVEKNAKKKISSIFKKYGEDHFRDLETKALKSLLSSRNAVIACGGGTVLRDENRRTIRSLGKAFFLKAKPELIDKRLRSLKTRPLLNIADNKARLAKIKAMLKHRAVFYKKAADHTIDTSNLSVSEIVSKIARIAGL